MLLAFASQRTVVRGNTVTLHLAAALHDVVSAPCGLYFDWPQGQTNGQSTSPLLFDADVVPWMDHACTSAGGCDWPVSAAVQIPSDAASGAWVLRCDPWHHEGDRRSNLMVIVAPPAPESPAPDADGAPHRDRGLCCD